MTGPPRARMTPAAEFPPLERPPAERLTVEAACIRFIDVVLALLLIAFTLPLTLAVLLAVYAQDRAPPLFAQRRIGKGGREFLCLKFRSMAPGAEEKLVLLLAANPAARAEWERGHKLLCDPRITRLGALLRQSSLDELPQLLNVLCGDMSMVGPRPIVAAEAVRYGRRFATYCSVVPGLTGLWQVSGRNAVSYRRRVAMDVVYARRRCFRLYVWLLIATVPAVLLRRGAA